MTYFLRVTKWLAYILATLIILAATLVTVGRLLTPYLNEHRSDFEVWASQLLKTPVRINQVHISWNVYVPELTFDQVDILNKDTQKPTFEIQHIKVNLKIFQSLLQRQPIPSYIKIAGVNVTLHAEKSGQVSVAGIGQFSVTDNLTGTSAAANAVADWIFSQPALVLDDINIKYIPETGPTKSVTLYKLSLHNTQDQHLLKGDVTLHQEISTSLTFDLSWRGDLAEPEKISAEAYIYLEAVSLPQWLNQKAWRDLQIKQGLGSAKIWLAWNHGQLQKIQSQFQIYQLELYSLITKKTQRVTRLNGHVGWKQEGKHQVFAGTDILIDLPEHLWPTTSFSITLPLLSRAPVFPSVVEVNAGPLFVANPITLISLNKANWGLFKPIMDAVSTTNLDFETAIQVSYLDLMDVSEVALMSGLLPDKFAHIILALEAKGDVRSLNVRIDDLINLENNTLEAEFSGLTNHPWEKIPGVKNLSGSIHWEPTEGDLKINAEQTTITANALFPKPLEFDQMQGDFHLQKDDQNIWLLKAKNLHLMNADLNASANVTLTLPPTESPTIDLSANFSLANISYISRYLTLKPLDPDLNKWLKQAFDRGQLTGGKAILQGRMSDFPFDQGKGKFLVSAEAKDLEFHFAPEWPAIDHTNGKLVFSGHTMTVDIDSGQILNNPITKVRAEIPYIGPDRPQILSVQGMIQGDLTQAIRIIHESPLQKKIGKELGGLNLSGPMQLNLALTIPVKRPENTKVTGDVTFSKTNLDLPEWNVMLNQMKGTFHFTEQDIQATNVQGRFLDEPITLSIHTEHPKNAASFVKVTTLGKMSIAAVQKWLTASPLSNVIDGTAMVDIEINLVSSDQAAPTQVIVRSNLQGVTVKLPDGFGKKANETTNLVFITDLKPNQPMQTKIMFGKLFSAAATIDKTKTGWQFLSGELRLGSNGQAAQQKLPGFLITGQFDTLDWNAIKKYAANVSLSSLTNNNETKSDSIINNVRAVDIRANKIVGLAQKLTRARIQINKAQNSWTVNLTSAEMAGQILLPNSSDRLIQAKFQYLYLTPVSGGGLVFDPKSLPPFSFVGNEVRYNGKSLGRVNLNVVSTQNGVNIKTLRIDSGVFNLDASGEWTSQKTHLQGKLTSKNVANFLKYISSSSSNLVGSSGTGSFDLTWPGAPYNAKLSTITGTGNLKLTAGRIINLDKSTNAKMGFGRMLNILSLESLTRRLSLNFSDLYEKGYSFDSMSGNFTLKNGNANLENTHFEGSVARIDIAGRIGLVAKDYNVIVGVTAYVTGSLPVVAAIAINPIVGVAAWAVEKIASHAFSKATTHRYSITGSWNNPVWKEK